MTTDVLVRVCRENPALLKSLITWFDELELEQWKHCARTPEMNNILRAQGAAALIPVLKARLEKLVARKAP